MGQFERRRRRARITAATAGAAVLLAVHAVTADHVVDDAFISFRYARNLVEGHGLVFNPGERVEGFTNFLWVLLAAPAIAAGIDPLGWARALGLTAGVGTLGLIAWISRSLGSDRPAIPAWLLAASSAFAAWCWAGLETSFYAACVTAAMAARIAWERTPSRRRAIVLGLAAAAALLTRPDGALFAAVLLVPLPRRRSIRNGGPGTPWAAIALAGGALVGLEAFRVFYYDAWLPNTFYAKTGGGGAQVLRGLDYLRERMVGAGGPILVFAALGFFTHRHRPGVGRATAATGLYLAYVAAVGGDSMLLGRFAVPVLPWVSVLLARGLERAAAAWSRPRSVRVLLAAAAMLGSIEVADPRMRAEIERRRTYVHEWITIGRWMGESLPPDTRIAVGAAGAMPYYSGLETVDYFGLTDPHIARAAAPGLGRGPAGHERGDGDYVLGRRPHLILGHVRRSPEPIPGRALLEFFGGTHAERSIRDHPRFAAEYEPVAFRIGDLWLNCFKRKDWDPNPPAR